jgi:hypothetical protein
MTIKYCTFLILTVEVLTVRNRNAAQVLGAVLASPRYLEKLDVGEVQSFIMQILNRVELHLRNRWELDVYLFYLTVLTVGG